MKNSSTVLVFLICTFGAFITYSINYLYFIPTLTNPSSLTLVSSYPISLGLGFIITYSVIQKYFPGPSDKVNSPSVKNKWWEPVIAIILLLIFLEVVSKLFG